MKKYLALFALAILTACGTPQVQTQASPIDQARVSMYQVESGYKAALQVANAYAKLPRCGSIGATQICSRFEVIQQLQKADDVANAAISAAEATVRRDGAGANVDTAIDAANQALAALTKITATLQLQ